MVLVHGVLDDLRAVVDATGGTPHVVAHSYGALIAIHAAAAGVEMRSLVLYEPPLNVRATSEETRDRVHRAVDEGRLDDAIALMAKGLAGVTDEELSVAMAVPPVRNALRGAVTVVPRELDAIWAVDQPGSKEPCLELPVLFLAGERDSSAAYPRPEQLADIAVDSESVTLEGQGHLAHTFAPAAFADAVLAFVDRH